MAPEVSRTSRRRRAGSITLVALCLTTALGIALGSYLALCFRSAQFSARKLQQDRVRQLAQNGLEEALWALNQNLWANSGPDGNASWTINAADRNVTLAYPLFSNGADGTVTITITNYTGSPSTAPIITSAATLTLNNGETFTKTLQGTAGPLPLFGNAIASAEEYVSFTAAGLVDSWASDPDNNPATPRVPYSFTAGTPSNYAAVVAGNDNGNYGVVLTQATVRGYVATFGNPVSYATSGSPAGSIVGPATPSGVKVDTSRIGKSAFIPLLTVSTPPTGGPYYKNIVGGILSLVTELLTGPSNITTYKTANLDIDGGLINLLLGAANPVIDRPTKFIITGNLKIDDGILGAKGKITIKPTGSLEIYVTGSVEIGGNGFDNQTNDPSKLAIFSSSSSGGSIIYDTTVPFCGVIYSDVKPIDIRKNATFTGAILARNYVRFSNAATAPIFHYDTALRNVRFENVSTPYILKQVTDI